MYVREWEYFCVWDWIGRFTVGLDIRKFSTWYCWRWDLHTELEIYIHTRLDCRSGIDDRSGIGMVGIGTYFGFRVGLYIGGDIYGLGVILEYYCRLRCGMGYSTGNGMLGREYIVLR